jgi:hypothetical protein
MDSRPTIDEAIALVPGLVGLGASAVELMVAPALTAAGQAFAETPCLLENPRSQGRCPARRDRRRGLGLARSNTAAESRTREYRQADQAGRVHERRRGHRARLARPRGTSGFDRQESPGRLDAHHGGRLFSAGAFGTGCARRAGTTCQAWVHSRCRGTRSSREPSFHSRRKSRDADGLIPVLGFHDRARGSRRQET